ncbi:hypothetical protein T03_10976 [Trichinella britovi]|uniref:Uncharacterized protein n=1 Tax=Trichinella britovi TaxID=45882 RepID=A0A0V1D0A7_TRIBR|nr:hypothetical protein T03_10976 [Trichinella britovi]
MELHLSRQKVSVMLYICHNSGGQLLKKHQSEMWLTARLSPDAEPGEENKPTVHLQMICKFETAAFRLTSDLSIKFTIHR